LSAVTEEVKTASRPQTKRGLSRHFEGYELALVTVGIVASVAFLVVPRATTPDVLPAPRVDLVEARRTADLDRERARLAEANPLPYEVRGAGEAFRAFGLANATRNPLAMSEKLKILRRTALEARQKHGDDALLRLLSIQTELFVRALARWEAGEDVKTEIAELGGDLLEKAANSRWITSAHFVGSDLERRTLFRVRWVDLLGVRSVTAFVPSANEWRIYYRFLLAHPEHSTNPSAAAHEQLAYVAAVEKVDLGFPGLFARGVLFHRLGDFDKSAEAFRGHLNKHPTGPWRLRAQNHLASAAQLALQRARASGIE
jgi:hypothetical protein